MEYGSILMKFFALGRDELKYQNKKRKKEIENAMHNIKIDEMQ